MYSLARLDLALYKTEFPVIMPVFYRLMHHAQLFRRVGLIKRAIIFLRK